MQVQVACDTHFSLEHRMNDILGLCTTIVYTVDWKTMSFSIRTLVVEEASKIIGSLCLYIFLGKMYIEIIIQMGCFKIIFEQEIDSHHLISWVINFIELQCLIYLYDEFLKVS